MRNNYATPGIVHTCPKPGLRSKCPNFRWFPGHICGSHAISWKSDFSQCRRACFRSSIFFAAQTVMLHHDDDDDDDDKDSHDHQDPSTSTAAKTTRTTTTTRRSSGGHKETTRSTRNRTARPQYLPEVLAGFKSMAKLPSPESGISELDQTAFPLKRAEFKHESPRMPAKMLPSSTGKIQRLQGQKVGRVVELALPTGTRACITLIGNGNDTTPGCSTHSLI